MYLKRSSNSWTTDSVLFFEDVSTTIHSKSASVWAERLASARRNSVGRLNTGTTIVKQGAFILSLGVIRRRVGVLMRGSQLLSGLETGILRYRPGAKEIGRAHV